MLEATTRHGIVSLVPSAAPGEAVGGLYLGEVVAFETDVGLGEIAAADFSSPVPFHCMVISDGTRDIGVGQRVLFCVQPHAKGTVMAVEVTKA